MPTTASTPSVLRFLSSRSLASPKPATPELADAMPFTADSGKSGFDDKVAAAAATPDSETTVEDERTEENGDREPELDFETCLRRIVPDIDRFVEELASEGDCQIPPDVPDGFERLLVLVEEEIGKCDSGKWYRAESGASPLLEAVGKVSRLGEVLARFQAESKYGALIDRATDVVQRAMAFLEEEFRGLLEESKSSGESNPSKSAGQSRRPQAVAASPEADSCVWQELATTHPSYTTETVAKLARIASAMVSSGYETECCQVYSIMRRNALEESLSRIGFEKISIDEVQKMGWESLEREITAWTTACKRCVAVCFPGEQRLCKEVFAGGSAENVAGGLLGNICRGVVIHLLNFAEAVALTKKSAEKVYRLLDMYEGLRDLAPLLDELFPAAAELKSETAMAKSRLGEAAVAIFSDLESLIKTDNGKTQVPGGAVHPLTRWLMNYIKLACQYKDTMEQVFLEHGTEERECDNIPESAGGIARDSIRSPFVAQLAAVMDLLDANLESKSKLYRELPLSYIFLMNNGRYIMKKIKESAEVHSLLGDTRKRSAELRQYHKNYTRETWGKVLACLRDEGLMQGKGSVNKQVLKERLKSFNAMFEEIHKTQSTWMVADEQLRSELRVSIGAVVVPAYRSFLGRFCQHLDAGRRTEKYVKFGPEELETYIDDLFDGTQTSTVKRR